MLTELRRKNLITERAKAFCQRTFFRAEPKGPGPGVDFSSSRRHPPFLSGVEVDVPPDWSSVLGTERAKALRQRFFSEPSLKAPLGGIHKKIDFLKPQSKCGFGAYMLQ
jgi:hypothetical protein